MLLPALLAVLGYIGLYAWPEQQALGKLKEQAVQMRQRAPGLQLQVAQKRQQVAQADDELKAVQQEIDQLDERWKSLAGSASPGRLHAEKIDHLTALLIRNGLTVLEVLPATGDNQAKVPQGLEAIAKRVGQHSGGKPVQYRLRVSGSYLGLLRVLEKVNDGDPVAIPINLSMKQTEEGIREWVMVIWL